MTFYDFGVNYSHKVSHLRQNEVKAVRPSKADVDTLRSAKLFRSCPEMLVLKILIAEDCEERCYKKGEIVYDRHSFKRSLGIILDGSIRVTKENADARPMLISTLYKGSMFGAAALFNETGEYATKLTAIENCRIVFFPQRLMERTVEREPEIAKNYIRYLSERILFLNRKMYFLTAGTAEQKLANFALENLSADVMAPLPLSMTELATALNISRASLYRAVDTLTESGALLKEGKKLGIADEALLRQYTQQNKEEVL